MFFFEAEAAKQNIPLHDTNLNLIKLGGFKIHHFGFLLLLAC